MSLNSTSPIIVIGDNEVVYDSFTCSDQGNNTLVSLVVKSKDTDLNRSSLRGKQIKLFLNEGTSDNIPYFRGIINEVIPSDRGITIKAQDMRYLLTKKSADNINITDDFNYDGYTLGQFLIEYIETNINVDDTLIGLDYINDTKPTVSLSGFRANDISPYDVVKNNLTLDTSDLTNILKTSIAMRDDGKKSNIIFVREKNLDEGCVNFNEIDGISSISYIERPSPNRISAKVLNRNVNYKHEKIANNFVVSDKLRKTFDFPDEAIQEAFVFAERSKDRYEVKLTVDKGHYLDIGNAVNIYLHDNETIRGKHRIVSKTLTGSPRGTMCSLSLNKANPILSEFLQ